MKGKIVMLTWSWIHARAGRLIQPTILWALVGLLWVGCQTRQETPAEEEVSLGSHRLHCGDSVKYVNRTGKPQRLSLKASNDCEFKGRLWIRDGSGSSTSIIIAPYGDPFVTNLTLANEGSVLFLCGSEVASSRPGCDFNLTLME